MAKDPTPRQLRKWKRIRQKLDRLKFYTPPSAEEIKLRTQAEKLFESR